MNRLRRGNLYLYSSITTRFSCSSHVTLYDSDLIYMLLPNINDNIRFWFTRVHNFLFKYSLYIYIIHIHIWLWDCQCIFCVLKSRTFLGNICLVACGMCLSVVFILYCRQSHLMKWSETGPLPAHQPDTLKVICSFNLLENTKLWTYEPMWWQPLWSKIPLEHYKSVF